MEKLNINYAYGTTPQTVLIQLEGALCAMDAIDFKNSLLQYIERYQMDMTIDLSAVAQVDLGGLNALAIAYRKMKGKGRTMQLLVPENGDLHTLMSLTKLDNFLPVQYASLT